MAPTMPSGGKGSGGSALKRLRETLTAAGVVGAPKLSRKKAAKAKASGLKLERRPQVTIENPFERKVQRVKHEVLGRKIKGHEGKPTLSRSRAQQKRAASLLVEHQRRDKMSEFVDRRFGETDESLTAEEKMIERFARERQRHSASRFSLEDGEELTHLGQSLSALDDDALAAGSDFEEEDDGNLSADLVARANFGGFYRADDGAEGEGNEPRTKREIMMDVIAKSKMYKRERQKEKEAVEDLREQIDAEFDDIRQLLVGGSKKVAGAENREGDGEEEEVVDEEEPAPKRRAAAERPTAAAAGAEPDDYDDMIKALATDRKAKPTNRLKTMEELALEERMKLEALERDRLRRMHGEGTTLAPGAVAASGDDLDTNVAVAENPRKKALPIAYKDGKLVQLPGEGMRNRRNEAVEAASSSEEEGADDDEDEDNEDDEEGEEAEDDADEDDDEEDGTDHEEGSGDDEADDDDALGSEDEDDRHRTDLSDLDLDEALAKPKPSRETANESRPATKRAIRKQREEAMRELPYVLPVPDSAADFAALVRGRPPAELAEAITRIRTYNHAKVAAGNLERLQLFFDILLDYVEELGSQSPVPFDCVNAMMPGLMAMATEMPDWAAECCRARLTRWEESLRKDLEERALRGKEHHVGWPAGPVLLPLSVVAHLFPDTDLRHTVLTPLRVYAAECLGMAPVWTLRDAACGLFVATIMWRLHQRSQRFVPEAFVFLERSLACLLGAGPAGDAGKTDLPSINANLAECLAALDLEAALPEQPFAAPETRWSLLQATLRLAVAYVDLYSSHSAVTAVLRPLTAALARTNKQLRSFPPAVKVDLERAQTKFADVVAAADRRRYPLQLQRHRPVALKEYAPRFEESFNPGKKRDVDEERQHAKRLQHVYKREFKAAKRELRKDNQFLADVKLKETIEKDREYKEKIKGIYNMLEQEQAGMTPEEKRKLKKRK